MYTENVAGGENWEFPKCKGGGAKCIQCINFSKI